MEKNKDGANPMIELKNRDERIAAEIADTIEKAKAKSADCDCVLVIMQHKDGGIVYEANDSTRLEPLSFIARSFLIRLHTGIDK